MARTYEVRKGCRFAVRCGFRYFGDGFVGEGTLWDLSSTGWRATGNHHLKAGMEMAVYLMLPDGATEKWLHIESAVVRWAEGASFGWEVKRIDKEARVRLESFLDTLTAE